MIYSCFDQPSGLYRYFEVDEQIPLNGDLPVPKWPAKVKTKIGVPGTLAGRPLPKSAKYVGTGWTARGIVASCDAGAGLGDLFDTSMWPTWWPYAGGALAGALVFYLYRSK